MDNYWLQKILGKMFCYFFQKKRLIFWKIPFFSTTVFNFFQSYGFLKRQVGIKQCKTEIISRLIVKFFSLKIWEILQKINFLTDQHLPIIYVRVNFQSAKIVEQNACKFKVPMIVFDFISESLRFKIQMIFILQRGQRITREMKA